MILIIYNIYLKAECDHIFCLECIKVILKKKKIFFYCVLCFY